MQQNYLTTKSAGLGQNIGPGYPPNASWSNPNGVTGVGSNASVVFAEGGQNSDTLLVSDFGFAIPDFAVIDGVSVTVNGSQEGCYGSIIISAAATSKSVGSLNTTYGDSTDLWGVDEITPSQVNDSDFGCSIDLGDQSGGDGIAGVGLVEITVYWHVDIKTAPADVPTRVEYKVYSRDGQYLGNLPAPSSPFTFAQDINSAGSSIVITVPKRAENITTVEPLLTDDEEIILTDNNDPILASKTDTLIAKGSSDSLALFKNSNRVRVWMYNYWYPNGKLMFSGQINRVAFSYGTASNATRLTVISDGLDLNNFIARGYPFSYTNDVSQASQNGYVTVRQGSGKNAGEWERYGQTWRSSGSANNIAAITLKLMGTANVTVSVFDRPGGNLLGSATRSVAVGTPTDVQFDIAPAVIASPSTDYFMAVSVGTGQSVRVYRHGTSSTYANGSMYHSSYSGGSGGGQYFSVPGDFYFIAKRGTPTTTATYSNQDPITGMVRGVLLDYNARGGLIKERNLTPAGYNLTYQLNVAFVFDAIRDALKLAPAGYYSYIDLGTAEIDIEPVSSGADFTIVRGKDVNSLDLALSIEQVKNYYLFTGGEVSPGVNLFKDYLNNESASWYGMRTASRTDNRVTQNDTADANGISFIIENSNEVQETTVTIDGKTMDLTLLLPGKTIGFRNFGNFIDSLVVQIVRREFRTNSATLTLGRVQPRTTDEIQRINRDLLNEQTANNPSAPS